ncbi:MAG TPA: hypothetical protein VIP05_27330 [Burkholderiaceae bacterium]
MNKREFVAGGVAAVVAAPAFAQGADAAVDAAPASLQDLLSRTRRLPDLAGRAGADAFEAYVGERFEVARGPGVGEQLRVAAIERVARCRDTEQFNVRFARVDADATPAGAEDGVRLLAHATGQRLALHLEHDDAGYTARFNLLA